MLKYRTTKTKRNDIEHEHQATLISILHKVGEGDYPGIPALPDLLMIFAIPNGGYRDPRTASKLKKEGVRAGIPDLMLPVPSKGAHGLFLEMKAPGKARNTSKVQREVHAQLLCNGYEVWVADNWKDALYCVLDYIDRAPYYGAIVQQWERLNKFILSM